MAILFYNCMQKQFVYVEQVQCLFMRILYDSMLAKGKE